MLVGNGSGLVMGIGAQRATPMRMINGELLREKIAGPLALGTTYPELTRHGLVCVTETTPRAEIERFAAALKNILAKPL